MRQSKDTVVSNRSFISPRTARSLGEMGNDRLCLMEMIVTALDRGSWRMVSPQSLAEEDGYDWGGTMDGEQVHYNRDLLKESHSRGGTCPWCPPGSATTYASVSHKPLINICTTLFVAYILIISVHSYESDQWWNPDGDCILLRHQY